MNLKIQQRKQVKHRKGLKRDDESISELLDNIKQSKHVIGVPEEWWGVSGVRKN